MEKFVTLRKMGHTSLESWVTLGKMAYTLKCGPHLEIWVTLVKVGYTTKRGSNFENGSHSTKCVILIIVILIIGRTWKIGTLGKLGHTRKNFSHFKMWVTLGKIEHI